jgi:hypothetical protein
MLDGVMLSCAVGALLGDSVVGAMLDGVTLGCAVGALLGDSWMGTIHDDKLAYH